MYVDFCNILNLIFNLLRKKKKLNTSQHVSIFLEEWKIDNVHFIILQFLPVNIGTQNANEITLTTMIIIYNTKNLRVAWNIRRYRRQRNVLLALCRTLERKRWEAAWKQLDAVRDKWRQSDGFLNYNWGPYGCNRFALL